MKVKKLVHLLGITYFQCMFSTLFALILNLLGLVIL